LKLFAWLACLAHVKLFEPLMHSKKPLWPGSGWN
jgi:hypothetical protein